MVSKSGSSSGSSSWSTFIKTIFIPLFAAALLYTTIFIVAIPLYRRYKNHLARYSAYAPLDSDLGRRTTSLFSPYIIDPSVSFLQKVKVKIRMTLWRWLVPGLADMHFPSQDSSSGVNRGGDWNGDEEEMTPSGDLGTNQNHGHGDGDQEEGGLFDAETGQSMVGFDVREPTGDGRGFGLGRMRMESQLNRDERARRFAREMNGQIDPQEVDSQRRLSRDLERAFGDDSDEDEDEDDEVVVRRNG